MPHTKRFLLVLWDGGGVVPPALGLARKLRARGHAVHVLGDPTIAAEAAAAGCTFGPWTTAPHRKTRDRQSDWFADADKKSVMRIGRDFHHDFFLVPGPRWIADLLAELKSHPVDVIISDFVLLWSLIVAEKLDLPVAIYMTHVFAIPTPGLPPIGSGLRPGRGMLGRFRDAAMRRLVELVYDKTMLPKWNEQRAAHGLAPSTSVFSAVRKADRILVLTSSEFDFTPPQIPANVHWVGPQLDDPSWTAAWRSPWPKDDSRPLILVALSTMFQDQAKTLRTIIAALSTLPVRALVTTGPVIADNEVRGTENVIVVSSAPHREVLRETAILLTHCGHGTTLKGLEAGVPLLCMPVWGDQLDNATRVVDRGAGVKIKHSASPEKIRTAVRELLKNPRYREAAQRMGAALARGAGCEDPVALLETLSDESAARPDEVS